MTRRLERLLELDHFLRTQSRSTTTELKVALGVSERTVRYDLEFLRDRYGAPIDYDTKRGFYYTDSNWRLPSIPLTQGELFALTLGARMLETYAGSAYRSVLRSAIQQLAQRLPEQTWLDLHSLAEDRIALNTGAEIQLDEAIWQQVEEACRNRHRIWIRYFVPDRNEVSERECDPYLIYLCRGNPYLIGYCQLRHAIRWFRIDRIQSIKILDSTFEIEQNFDRNHYFDKIFQFEVGGEPQSVVIWFHSKVAALIRERVWHQSQQIENHGDGSLTLRLTVSGMNDIKRWVLGYGSAARVLAPPQLVALMQEEVTELHQQYLSTEINDTTN
jgi:predicted DNA-binding transcriptional regulator YafY